MSSGDFTVDKILEDVRGRMVTRYIKAHGDYLVAVVMKDKAAARERRLELEDVLRESLGLAEVLGTLSTLRAASRILGAEGGRFTADRFELMSFATAAEKILHSVTFEDAVEDMVKRAPVTVRVAAERSAATIRELYGKGNVVAFAKSADQAVTVRAQELITSAIKEGIPEVEVGRSLKFGVDRVRTETAAWSEGYARMTFRTNLNTAVTAGRFRTAQDPAVKKVVPAFRFDSVGDGDTRDNHDAADGVILTVDHPAWRYLAPPLGYNCRCQVSHVSAPELRRMGRIDANGVVTNSRIPAAAKPDEGFRGGSGRPDLALGGRA